ncbi:MAG: hypothetical protein ACJA04_000725 [Cellvibrionaceae bacterium]|jgi:hypothetical protein
MTAAVGKQLMLPPLFGTFTGGLDIDDTALTQWISKPERKVFLIYRQKNWPLD